MKTGIVWFQPDCRLYDNAALKAACDECDNIIYWLIFELSWRDYFYLSAVKHGAELVKAGGIKNIEYLGRQNVVSYLIHEMALDWRPGARWFEHCLIDYDAASNYGNWNYLAGNGHDLRSQRYFNLEKQAAAYDPDGQFQALWLEP
jgi:deoxyribodipyrimidine photo-lyase